MALGDVEIWKEGETAWFNMWFEKDKFIRAEAPWEAYEKDKENFARSVKELMVKEKEQLIESNRLLGVERTKGARLAQN